jgi:hypothetical protein
MRERKYKYLVQENNDNKGWQDHAAYLDMSLSVAREVYQERLANPIWHNNGRRQWRLIRRCITDTVIS